VRAFNDMAERLQQSFQQMRELLLYDSLTQSLTRRGLLERSQWAQPRPAVLCLVGLDDFRALNDSVGHGTGDRLLPAVSERLQVPDGDVRLEELELDSLDLVEWGVEIEKRSGVVLDTADLASAGRLSDVVATLMAKQTADA